ncbi:MAG TPA: hypothetical protein VD996_05285 [Chitinophagaceae bacterium]|nr:hypothetical protein [Chitinophagaceae bacterium]
MKPKDYIMLVFGVAVLFMAFYTVFRYYRNAPKIILDGNFISFNAETFPLSDIQKVVLTGKSDFPYVVDFPMEAATVYFKDGTTKFIYDDMYKNSWELKSYLKQVIIEKKNFTAVETNEVSRPELDNEDYDTFKGNQFTSLRGITFWALIVSFVYMMITNDRRPTTEFVLSIALFSICWLVFHAWLMHYFEVSGKYLVIKNHLFFWKRKAYRLTDINEIVFETRHRMPNCLRVITKDFKNKLYPAGTLRTKTWLELKKNLENRQIKVRNECI